MAKDNLKKISAKKALEYIKDNTVIGLGGGETIGYLCDYLKEKIKSGFNIKVVTPSIKTRNTCIENGIEVLYTSSVEHLDVAFDGCDQLDEKLNALKSCGGIHSKEKIIASMADKYILLTNESKFVKKLDSTYPIVLEILEESAGYVKRRISEIGGKATFRSSAAKDGFTITDSGNLLLDVFFDELGDAKELQKGLKGITGVVETSLFVDLVSQAIIAYEDDIKIISK
ncbi:ribose 5-phosphate isomerase A [Clostridium acetobutylicum]|uniref:Ribose 5-phosphate isomerase A n=1 Tax=Clostridium acetobutylicum (strain ATCC 824 / DSM 792 / JCM 1419 / IAM 19013 / LMG 5710 / NBRC 13948 / NRRL B-527 / VKM B-1787 / 2291 / W) TaxID=272562 RepID=Q97J55_CLOAB|nr:MULTISPECIES: ribose 5-phosphate isomerase A [Clostridium]AAK79399.1 Ribose 5-phosphate isomerase [Clostridium acetobutylicum ATCC 824]ADZ20484.1 Ribose 5-phosphate isomerase [Clostridium acetobutylicum EA 2018]AEI34424.1 ribose 5-phosphate isomerase [Clostridium acetobutylicum DSM 1731]AWV81352.1 ribose 5-phosphate isomerase A [Clostridium acetobutylicum]MBC2392986.1 ribose 5-phosphate isomerase A [Clostridium acetobutylicum]